MEKPNAETTAAFERLIPDDPRAMRGQMFGHPCAFVFGQMFLGTFAQTLVIRVGEARAKALAVPPVAHFEPIPGRPWKEYLQVAPDALPAETLSAMAAEALAFTAKLPPKSPKAPRPRKPKA